MKTITIYTRDGIVELSDDTKQSKEEMAEELYKIVQANTLTFIHTTNSPAERQLFYNLS